MEPAPPPPGSAEDGGGGGGGASAELLPVAGVSTVQSAPLPQYPQGRAEQYDLRPQCEGAGPVCVCVCLCVLGEGAGIAS